MPTKLYKEDDYTLGALTTLASGGTVTRLFNFASATITTIYERKEEMHDQIKSYSSSAGSTTAVSVALSSQMTQQKFSDLDSQLEVEAMRARLVEFKGNPPPASNTLDKGKIAPPGPVHQA